MSKQKFEIRKATVDDAEKMSEIHAASWRVAYKGILPQKQLDKLADDHWVTYFQEWFEKGCIESYIAYDEAMPVGCVTCGSLTEGECADRSEIISMYVLPKYFGEGIGQGLMGKALDILKDQGFTHTFLWTLKENKRARAFYEKNGFALDEDNCQCERVYNQDAVKYIKYIEIV